MEDPVAADRRALGHVTAHRLAVLDGEIALQDALRLQSELARKYQRSDVVAYCSAFSLTSLDALEHDIDDCVATLKTCGIAITDDISRSRREAFQAIDHFRGELSTKSPHQPGNG